MFDADISLQEVAYRLSKPQWVASQGWRYVRESSTRFIPSEFNRLFRKVRPITMVSYARLRGLYDATRSNWVLRESYGCSTLSVVCRNRPRRILISILRIVTPGPVVPAWLK